MAIKWLHEIKGGKHSEFKKGVCSNVRIKEERKRSKIKERRWLLIEVWEKERGLDPFGWNALS